MFLIMEKGNNIGKNSFKHKQKRKISTDENTEKSLIQGWMICGGVTNLDSFGDVLHGVEQNEIKCTVFDVRLFFICNVNQYMP